MESTVQQESGLGATGKAWFDLIRVYNLPIPLSGMLAGAYAAPTGASWELGALVVAAVLGSATTQSFNDYEDRDVDKQNAAFRPIPSGRLSAASVLLGGHVFAVAAAVLSLVVEPWAVLAVIGVYGLTRYYSRLKQSTPAHHLLMPAALALTPIYGSLMVHHTVLPLAALASISIFLLDINMNVVGAFKDLWDGSEHEQVLPVVWGPHKAVALCMAAGVGGLAIQALALPLELAGPGILIPLGVALVLTVVSRTRLYLNPTAREGYSALQAGRLSECFAFPAVAAGVLPLDHALAVILCCVLLALYTQTIIPEAVLPPEADIPITELSA